jgi:protein phosphatase PTC1
VCSDQEAVELIRNVHDPQEASKILVDYALSRFSSDNLSCMVVRLDFTGKFEKLKEEEAKTSAGKVSEDSQSEMANGPTLNTIPQADSPEDIKLSDKKIEQVLQDRKENAPEPGQATAVASKAESIQKGESASKESAPTKDKEAKSEKQRGG